MSNFESSPFRKTLISFCVLSVNLVFGAAQGLGPVSASTQSNRLPFAIADTTPPHRSNAVPIKVTEVPPVWGFADLHAHPASNFAFGADATGKNGLFWGSFGGANSTYEALKSLPGVGPQVFEMAMATDLPACNPDTHSGSTLDFVQHATRDTIISLLDCLQKCIASGCITTRIHGPNGAATYSDWPVASSIEHQQMHITAIRRAYEGGLRLMFASVTDDELLSDLWHIGFDLQGNPIPTHDPFFDFRSATNQLTAIKNLVTANKDWMQVVTSPAEARQAISQQKLAIVLSLELNTLSADQIMTLVTNFGVRHVIPIHLIDNAFGGAAVYSNVFNSESNWVNGSFYQVVHDPHLDMMLSGLPGVLVSGPLGAIKTESNTPACITAAANYTNVGGGIKNKLGLKDSAQLLQLMSSHLLVDIVHMSDSAASQTLNMALRLHYPVMDSHTGLRDDGSPPQDDVLPNGGDFKVSERSLPYSQAVIIGKLGGVIGLGTSGLTNSRDPVGKWYTDYLRAQLEIARGNGGIHKGVALGTDMNGLSPLIAFDSIPTNYPITVAQTFSVGQSVVAPVLAPMYKSIGQTYNFQHDGIANYGMLPDFIQAISQRKNSGQAIKSIYRSAEDVIEMWEAVDNALVINPSSVVINRPITNQAFTTSAGLGYGATAFLANQYAQTFQASGGKPPYIWSVTNPLAMPPGLIFHQNGVITGTPTQSGLFTILVSVSDGSVPAKTCSQQFLIGVGNP